MVVLTSDACSMPGTPRSATPREATPTRLSSLTPADVNNATSLLHKLDAMKVNDLKMELKKRNLPISGSKPALIEKLKPALEAVIAAGKKQFKQPYKQIQIASGGLIILKPSPNSQLLTSSEGKEKTPEGAMSPAAPSLHEGTPDTDDSCSLTPLMLPVSSMSGDLGQLSLLGLLSPSESVHSLGTNSEIENILSERRDSLHSLHSNTTDHEFPLGLMEVEPGQGLVMPPPAPPPPPPPQSKTAAPSPLPPPPSLLDGHCSPAPAAHQQFLPPKQTSQQILLAKAALEAQLTTADSKTAQLAGSKTTRAGPKGQFIWPPVSVQSSQGTVITIRAMAGDTTAPSEPLPCDLAPASMSAPPVRNESVLPSSRPVSQLAAVFSQSPATTSLPMLVRLPQEPVPASELGLAVEQLPATLPSHAPPLGPDTGDNMAGAGIDIIKAQQQRIAELERALHERSRQQLMVNPQQHQGFIASQPPPQQQPNSIINTKHLLAQQIHNKHQHANNIPSKPLDNCESMDDVIDSILKTEGNDSFKSYHYSIF